METAFMNTVILLVALSFCAEVESECTFPKHTLDGSKLKAYQKLKPLIGKRFTAQDPDNQYKYFIGICTDAVGGEEGTDSQEGIVQLKKEGSSRHVIGKYTSSDIMSGTNWVYLEYAEGDHLNTHCNGEARRAVILFTCDPDATDESPGMKMLEEETTKGSDCYYLFELAHPEICEVQRSSSSLSIGSIIIIVFFSVALVYLIAGALYQRFVLGAKGMEQLPNYEFWKDFGNLQADGCNFICRSQDSRNSSPYKGLGDDQLEEPEERDDSLLPM